MMVTPVRLLIGGLVIFAIGFTLGTFNVDPLSAWIGTAGTALFVAGLVWLAVTKLARPRA